MDSREANTAGVVSMKVQLLSPAGKIPRVDPELKQRLEELPEDASIEEVVEVIRNYRPEPKLHVYSPEPEGLYRLTI